MTGPQDPKQSFLVALSRLEHWLGDRQIPHLLIGSLALSAHVDGGRSLDFDRPHAYDPTQRLPDVDLLVPRWSLGAVQQFAAAVRGSDFPVNVDTGAAEVYIDFRPAAQHSYLTHRKLRVAVGNQLFQSRAATLLGHPITTIDPRVLLHTFGTVGGVVRPKDVPNILRLAEAIGSGSATSQFTEKDCHVFSRYALARKRRYPAFIVAKHTWEGVMDVLPPKTARAMKHHILPPAQRALGRLNRTRGLSGPEAGL